MTKEILIEPEAPAPASTPAKAPARERRCETCDASDFPSDKGRHGECHANPPTHQLFVLMGPDPLRGQMVPQYQGRAAWPPVERHNWCRDKWQPKAKN